MSRYSSKQFDEVIRRKNEVIKKKNNEIRKLKKDIKDYEIIIWRAINEKSKKITKKIKEGAEEDKK